MNNVATLFSIKDLENLSGIKAHTIRIWEKRYEILSPSRTDSNIRFYDIVNLQKLLNVTLLYNNGLKISKIAKLDKDELQIRVRELASRTEGNEKFLNAMKLAMLNFDQSLFENTYNRLVLENSFRNIFVEVFIPLLHSIGLEWQSNSITPAHEHFISNLIKQKLHINIERVQQIPPKYPEKIFVLFLPMNEIHELGLLYIQYELILKGYHAIYLGQSVPLDNLEVIQKVYSGVTFVSYFTVRPSADDVPDYLDQFETTILNKPGNKLWILGRNTRDIDYAFDEKKINRFEDIQSLIKKI